MSRGGEVLRFRARGCLPAPDRWIEDAYLEVCGGRLVGVGRWADSAQGAGEVLDLGDVLVTPGTVNAHTHLELSGLAGASTPGTDFPEWIGHLMDARGAASTELLRRERDRAARSALASGTTLLGDIDSLGLGSTPGSGPRRVVLRELLDAGDPARTAQCLESMGRAPNLGPLERAGWSPHAPFSVSEELIAGVAREVGVHPRPVAMHWAETPDEVAWLSGDSAWFDRFFPRREGMHGVDLLERHGLLGPQTMLVHGNHPRAEEPERIAASGACVVHCPGSHDWFGRDRFDFERFRRAGVRLAIGTDSLVSNEALDLGRELALWSRSEPGVDPESLWASATLDGARALGCEGLAGSLIPGAWADWVTYRGAPGARRHALEWLVSGSTAIDAVWVAGRRIDPVDQAG